jgi:hypothetical protein
VSDVACQALDVPEAVVHRARHVALLVERRLRDPRAATEYHAQVEVVAYAAQVPRDCEGELPALRELVVVPPRKMLAKGGDHVLGHLRGDVVGLQFLRDSVDQGSTPGIIDPLRGALFGGHEFIGGRNGMDFEADDAVRLGAVDLHLGAGKLLGLPLLENGDDARGRQGLGPLQVEATRTLAQRKLALDAAHILARDLVRKVLLVKRHERVTVPRVEGSQPC